MEKMTEDDLAEVTKLNNKHIAAVGKTSYKKYQYLLSQASHAYLCRDNQQVIAFYLAFGANLPYNSKNYKFHDEQMNYEDSSFVYMDRIVVADEY